MLCGSGPSHINLYIFVQLYEHVCGVNSYKWNWWFSASDVLMAIFQCLFPPTKCENTASHTSVTLTSIVLPNLWKPTLTLNLLEVWTKWSTCTFIWCFQCFKLFSYWSILIWINICEIWKLTEYLGIVVKSFRYPDCASQKNFYLLRIHTEVSWMKWYVVWDLLHNNPVARWEGKGHSNRDDTLA